MAGTTAGRGVGVDGEWVGAPEEDADLEAVRQRPREEVERDLRQRVDPHQPAQRRCRKVAGVGGGAGLRRPAVARRHRDGLTR